MRIHGLQARVIIPLRVGCCPSKLPGIRGRSLLHATCSHARRPTPYTKVPAGAPVELYRGAKTKTTAKLKDLPQGALKLETYDDGADEGPRYPTVVRGHKNNMQKFKNCVVLTRVGSFYEVIERSFMQKVSLAGLTHSSYTLNKQRSLRHC